MSESVKSTHHSVFSYMDEFSSRVAAESGLPEDRYHLGKLIFHSLKEDPGFLLQIDGANDKSETNELALRRTINCAIAFRNMGLVKGDVIVLMAHNHIDLAIPLYAALYLGVTVAALETTLNMDELIDIFRILEPKLIIGQAKQFWTIDMAFVNAGLYCNKVTFDEGADCYTFRERVLASLNEFYLREKDIEDFKPSEFDPAETVALLTATRASTGRLKFASLTHKNLAVAAPYTWLGHSNFPPTKIALVVAPLQWLSTCFHYIFSPILKYTRLQISEQLSKEIFVKVLNKYKPMHTTMTPTLLKSLWTTDRSECDMTCFESIWLLGSAVSEDLLEDIKKVRADIRITGGFGRSEAGGLVFHNQFLKRGSVGKPIEAFDYKLVYPETLEEISEPNVNGELWLRGPTVSKEYYKCLETTAATFVEDGWFRSGDIFYRDDDGNFYYVERRNLLLKYKNHQISIEELEEVVKQESGVKDAVVATLPTPENGEMPVVFIVRNPDSEHSGMRIRDTIEYNWVNQLLCCQSNFNSIEGLF